jgi:MFS family permease
MFLRLSKNVLMLGIVSFFTDVSSEMILILLPLFYITLGAGGVAIGLIEGIAESIASLMKVYSGWYSDKIGKRKVFVTSGYTMSAIAKIFFAIATTWPQVLMIRFAERVGKGLRTSPRDALIADSTDKDYYGRAFGFHRAMDTSGAIIGVILALVLVSYFSYRQIFLLAFLPAALSVCILVFFVEERRKSVEKNKLTLRSRFGKEYKLFLIAVTVFGLANFSYAFIVLKANSAGASDRTVIAFYLLYNIVYAAISIPMGELSDRVERKTVIILGYLIFAFMCMGLALTSQLTYIALFFGLYGMFQAVMEGVQKAYVADLVEVDVRGSAYGLFHTILGLTALPASFIAGVLWEYINPVATFVYGAVMASLAALLLLVLVR